MRVWGFSDPEITGDVCLEYLKKPLNKLRHIYLVSMIFTIKPIGFFRSPFKNIKEVPSDCSSAVGEIIVFKEYEYGLKDIEGFSHIMVVWVFHMYRGYSLIVRPRHDTELRGVFATRSPRRPNSIAITVLELLERNQNILKVRGVDAVDGTPVIDIKPYTYSDRKEYIKAGWVEKSRHRKT